MLHRDDLQNFLQLEIELVISPASHWANFNAQGVSVTLEAEVPPDAPQIERDIQIADVLVRDEARSPHNIVDSESVAVVRKRLEHERTAVAIGKILCGRVHDVFLPHCVLRKIRQEQSDALTELVQDRYGFLRGNRDGELN